MAHKPNPIFNSHLENMDDPFTSKVLSCIQTQLNWTNRLDFDFPAFCSLRTSTPSQAEAGIISSQSHENYAFLRKTITSQLMKERASRYPCPSQDHDCPSFSLRSEQRHIHTLRHGCAYLVSARILPSIQLQPQSCDTSAIGLAGVIVSIPSLPIMISRGNLRFHLSLGGVKLVNIHPPSPTESLSPVHVKI